MNMGMAALEYAEKMLCTSEQNAARRCPYCQGTGHKQGPPLNHAPDTVVGVAFTVYGVAAPAGSKTVWRSKTGQVGVRDASKRSAPWKRLVAQAAGEAMGGAGLLEGPLSLTVAVVIPRPKSHYGARGLRPSAPSAPTTRPDLTKYLRGIEDAMTGIVWRDDAQVITQSAEKRYGEPARVSVRVLEVGP